MNIGTASILNTRIKFFFFALGMILVSGCASPRHAMVTPSPVLSPQQAGAPPTRALTYVVKPQDTLWSLGKRYGVSYAEIMRANGLTDPAQVPVGRVLIIPRPLVEKPAIPLRPNPNWTYIVVHHSATARGDAHLIGRLHRKRGFTNGLGYHFLIDNGTLGHRDGQIEISPRWLKQQEGAHCNAGGMNQHGIGICLVGDFTNRRPSAAQMESLVFLVEQLRTYYAIPRTHVIRHRDVPGKATECPGKDFPWGEFRSKI